MARDSIYLSRPPGRLRLEWRITVESALDVAELIEGFRIYVGKRFGLMIHPNATLWLASRAGFTTQLWADNQTNEVTLIITKTLKAK